MNGTEAASQLGEVVALAVNAALFRRDAFAVVAANPAAASAALWIPFLAGVSELVGQSYVLAKRRIGRVRALASLVLTGLVHVTAVVIWACACIVFLELDHLGSEPLLALLGAVSLGYSPRLLGLFTIAPFYGELLGRMLDAWAMACVGWGLWIVTHEPMAPVLFCAALGWLASFLARRFGGLAMAPLLRLAGLVSPGLRRV